MLDGFTKILGTVKICLRYSLPSVLIRRWRRHCIIPFIPEKINMIAIVTIVGGTVGGYLTFSGAHRLLDAGIKGKENIATGKQKCC